MPLIDGVTSTVRPRLLVCAAPQRWSELLRTAEPVWELVWVSSREQFSEHLARERFPVALWESDSSSPATYDDAQFQSTCLSPFTNHSGTPILELADGFPECREEKSPSQSECNFLARIHSRTVPSELRQWLNVALNISRLADEKSRLQRRLAMRRSPLMGNSAASERLRQQVASAALYDWPVLIQGEPGTGRDLVAQAIHEASERSHRPLIKVNCRVHTSVSLERELFGQAAGRQSTESFAGRFELADGGILLLDGIEEISLPLQNLLAGVLETRTFQRLDDVHHSPLTARIIAISTQDLSELAATGRFRADLLKHFDGPVLTPPPLREIKADIAVLTEHLLQRIARQLGEAPRRLLIETLDRLQQHNWPGNIRELELLLERACSTQQGSKLTPDMVAPWLNATPAQLELGSHGVSLAQMERQLIEATFTRCAGNRELTAQTLQIGLRTLSGKLREYGYPPRGGPGSNQIAQHRDAA